MEFFFCWSGQFVWKLTFSTLECLAEAELLTAEILHVVFFQSSADHLRCVVLAGQLGKKRMQDRGQNVTQQKVTF